MTQKAIAGNKGDKIRSDCFIELELRTSGGISINLTSKVKSLYGKDIENQIKAMLQFYEVKDAHINVEDSGALPFVISARLESAIHQCIPSEKEFLPPILQENLYLSSRDRTRQSRLYLPGNNPAMMINAGIHNPDGIILDLEDSVAFEKKQEARYLVRNALRQIDFYGAERMVRINQIPAGLGDLNYIIPHHVHLILVPKCESASQIHEVEKEIVRLCNLYHITQDIFLMPILETALGIEKAFEIATSSERIVAMAIGLEDYTADLGVQRTPDGKESFFARSRLVNACKAAGIQAIDSVFSDVGDMDGLAENIRVSKSLGFEGMGCIHPRQIEIIKAGYSPDLQEIEKAMKITDAFLLAEEQGLGVVALGTKMIDAPVVKRARKTLELAIKGGLINSNWRNEYVRK